MKRRAFLQITCALGAMFAAPFLRRVNERARVACVEALRAGTYPGPVVPLDKNKVALPGKWAG